MPQMISARFSGFGFGRGKMIFQNCLEQFLAKKPQRPSALREKNLNPFLREIFPVLSVSAFFKDKKPNVYRQRHLLESFQM